MDTALSPPVGQLLGGRYHVGSRIARGGMATVYLATDTRLDRVVALKIAHLELSDDAEFVRRFIGEARSAARLSSPNVVGVYDQGSDGRLHYIAMEYVAGRTLRQLLSERGRLSPVEALDIMTGVLSGLAAAHQAGLAHRDVKPENVLLTRGGEVKVADFGLARSVAGAVQTKGGMIIGTAGYLAPEQVSGGTSDARTDVYAAGIMLFELLTGTQPHTGGSPLAVAYKHVNEVVPAPSSVLPGLAPPLDALVAMATSRDPDLRPANAGQFLRAIDEVRAGNWPADSGPHRVRHPYQDPYGDDLHHSDPGRFGPLVRPGAVGASALPSLSPHSASVVPADETSAVNHTLVVPTESAYGDYPPRYRGHRAVRRRGRAEPWLHDLLFGRRLLFLLGGLGLVLVVALATWWLSSGRYTKIPAMRGLTVSAATTDLRNLGLQVRIGKAEHDSLPKGEVIATSPDAGSKATGGSTVALTVSLGPVMLPMPNVTGQPLTQAEALVTQAHLTVGQVLKATSSSVPVGNVISTTPTAYTNWPQNKPVSLTVSEGPGLASFVGQPLQAAQAAAQAGGFTINATQVQSNEPAGTVLSQSPGANTPITPGEVVNVRVSQGPPAVPVPDVQGWPLQQAIKALRQAGFQVQVDSGILGDRVTSYDPTGSQPKGTTITLHVGLGG
ncbi:MAG TPA: PASTA domain-containing protein [Streptosporangiaceae bacterium]|nr:PASTA domain-containing protein [Streptosporangiaceae bacterium]